MPFFLIASPPAGVFYGGLLVGVMVVAAILWAFLSPNAEFGWRRLLAFCVVAVVLGPLVSVGLAGLNVVFGDVSPLDRWWIVSNFISVGTFAGMIAAVLIGVIGSIRIVLRQMNAAQPQPPPAEDKPGS